MTEAARKSIIETARTSLLASQPDIKIQLDPNISFEPPVGKWWARITILDGESRHETTGGASNGYVGEMVAFIDVFCPKDKGSGNSARICTNLRKDFRRFRETGAFCLRTEAGPEVHDDAWWKKQQILVFQYRERG